MDVQCVGTDAAGHGVSARTTRHPIIALADPDRAFARPAEKAVVAVQTIQRIRPGKPWEEL